MIESLSSSSESVAGLATLLIEATAHGASVSFMHPLSREKAEAYWREILSGAAAGEYVVLGAREDGRLIGTATLVLALPENQPHRGEVQKVLVAVSHRRRGVARTLMLELERRAASHGRTVLVLDAVTGGPGARLYESLGWQRVGDVPDFALFPDGRLCSTTYYWKRVP
jgi:GNAT superfamily N-acetyltransferase